VPDATTLEDAVKKLTLVPATVHGLTDRGVVREGAAADLVLIDQARLRAGATRLVRDFPGDAPRFVVDAEGYVATIVNGEVLLEDGKHTGALPATCCAADESQGRAARSAGMDDDTRAAARSPRSGTSPTQQHAAHDVPRAPPHAAARGALGLAARAPPLLRSADRPR
jgi:N-acyl-D-aspartate/D-glutamate deacylase